MAAERLAAEQENVWALANLGYMYESGRGVPKSDLIAYVWWSLAAAQGDGIRAMNSRLHDWKP